MCNTNKYNGRSLAIDSHRLFAFPVVIRESSIWPFTCTTSIVGAYTTKNPKDATEWIQHMREILGEMHESARKTQEENKEYSKKRHDEKATERYFEIK